MIPLNVIIAMTPTLNESFPSHLSRTVLAQVIPVPAVPENPAVPVAENKS